MQALMQFLRKARLAVWRLTHRVYWNAHAGTSIPRDARVARTAVIELETGGWVKMGRGGQLSHYSVVAPFGGSISIGDNVYIGHHAVIYGHGGVTIGDDTMIAQHVSIVPMSHGVAAGTPIRDQAMSKQGVTIGKDCWIGAGAVILDGVTLGDGCVIGAGAVVRESMPANSVAAGVPAKVIRQRA
jgi:acetyltransferase-like isoleucine patch superfamily enzyme